MSAGGFLASLTGPAATWVAVGVLLASYAVIMSERLNRAIVALLGAVLMIATGILDQPEAVAGIDFNTIGLLAGMMVIVSIARKSGIFEYLAIRAAKLARGSPVGMLALLALVTAVVSALLDNVTTVLLIVPVTLVICNELKVPPYPYLLSQVVASNIGGTATLIGDPPNIIIGAQVGLSFNSFVSNLAPVIAVILAVHLVAIHLFWGRDLRTSPAARARIMAMDERAAITDVRLLVKSLVVLGLVLAAFMGAHFIGLESGTIGIGGAALLLLLDNLGRPAARQSENVTQVFNEVEWVTLFFFIGLFVVVRGVEHTGVLHTLAGKMLAATGGELQATGLGILWSSALLSATVGRPWSLLWAGGLFSAGLIFHFWWTLSHGVHPLTAEPRDKYYALRGWTLPAETR